MAFFLDDITGDLWTHLKDTDKKIVLYGMGDGADKIKRVLDERSIGVSDIMASDGFVRGQSFMGHRVKTLSEIESEYGDGAVILVCFGSRLPEVMENIYEIAQKHELYAPNVPVTGDGVFDLEYANANKDELQKVYKMLADEQSKKVFENVIRYKLSGDIKYLKECETPSDEKFDLLNIGIEETVVDLGAYDGDTLIEFLNGTSMQFRKLYAMEPDNKNYRKLKRSLYMIGSARLEAYNAGAWDEDTTITFNMRAGRGSTASGSSVSKAHRLLQYRDIKMMKTDTMLRGDLATYIKIDVEGAEENALRGAKETIANFRPKLNIALYHRNEDLFKLPLLVNDLNRKYKFYMRHHPYIPDWDTNLYCV